ncbi:MFS transporter [Nonomuraea jiangxiensis]|uniref:Major Facilitator Superfamily protein n=1 Tax=Nonomuraea jiangxiensis TaxID=633440 RepID=A0A1G8JGZ0_9ACTN|nr:MFS transporter [Nonomuraea jiangxiensis]SDI30518.1 Major Facilitator Superfamily protein [Nonomuraea jiangxiensis]
MSVTFRQVFASGEYRALWSATALSDVGDQLARVAVSVIAYETTSSVALTAATYALTFVPALLGGPLLGGVADRLPRREVMFACDLARAGLVALMAAPGIPLAVICVLLFAVHLLEAPVRASYSAVLPHILDGGRYVTGLSAIQLASQSARLLGFTLGGVAVATIQPSGALLLDAATFLAAALIVRLGLAARPAPEGLSGDSPLRSIAAAVRVVTADPRLRLLAASAWLAGFYAVPTALAVPYAGDLGVGSGATGLLMAAGPAGAVAGVLVLGRWVSPAARQALLGPLAVATSLPLTAMALRPGLVVTLLLWVMAGALSAYQVIANAEFVRGVPDERRGQAVGLVGSVLVAVQGIGIAVAGAVAELTGTATAIALSGAAGVAAALPIAIGWHTAGRSPAKSGAG